jgi:REP element-mobilizing transposase RayT
MANTYSQLYVQFVFSVKGRQDLIKESFREELEKVICGIVSNHKCKVCAIYCNPDHTHILLGLHPSLSPSKIMEQVKSGASHFINQKNFLTTKFSWQDGYGAFTYSKSEIDRVVKYILNQPEHHKKHSFRDEYLQMLTEFEIDFDDKYLFEWFD